MFASLTEGLDEKQLKASLMGIDVHKNDFHLQHRTSFKSKGISF